MTPALAAVALLLAQVADLLPGADVALYNSVVQTGSFGLLTYIVVRLGPWLYEQMRADRAEMLASFQASLQAKEDSVDRRLTMLVAAIEKQSAVSERSIEKLCERNEKAVERLAQSLAEDIDRLATQLGHAPRRRPGGEG